MDEFVQCIYIYSFIIDGLKLYTCQLFDLRCNTLILNYTKVFLSGAPYVFDVAENKNK